MQTALITGGSKGFGLALATGLVEDGWNVVIDGRQPLALDEFSFLRDVTKVTPKITLPSPSTMHFYRCTDYADSAVYSSVDTFFADIVAQNKLRINNRHSQSSTTFRTNKQLGMGNSSQQSASG